MKTLPAGLAAMLATGVTTRCNCWRIERADGQVFGFTDHDRQLSFDGVDYEPATALSASETAASLGLAVDTLEAAGALSSDAINEDELARKLWDNASVTQIVVDWSDTANRVVTFAGSIGEVERGPLAFRAELRSLSHALNQRTGRIFGSLCDADLGDARCAVNLALAAFSAAGTASAAVSRWAFRTTGLAAFETGWFKAGKLTWTSGANAGAVIEIKRHVDAGATHLVELAEEMPFDIGVGDAFAITAGCDKTVETCKAKFDNVVNFRGFPSMPGNDWVTSYPNREDGNDGGGLGD
ncbi:DUF2163 domain-containing protein [Nitratireductor mangrovi]|uniref:DUF2163 domain-containing protein n=1 Tax=Nitratireductor mangrovi TaxID=2599600 RepID=A0A5B8KTV5_9HYPH|nr:DUF2163 domain-containing protein [Nitratireductor mangrovi]QDY99056.1 DUF2163 domain-containing protein [Nitratireductor mangrovi]